jgi:hypothetical protein
MHVHSKQSGAAMMTQPRTRRGNIQATKRKKEQQIKNNNNKSFHQQQMTRRAKIHIFLCIGYARFSTGLISFRSP